MASSASAKAMQSSFSKNVQVQGTNDNSIVSKLSATNGDYFTDEFLKYFVQKPQKRSAIINRGYYIRFKSVDLALKEWCSALSSSIHKKSHIISVGSGFDTSYFRLKSNSLLPDECRYIEIDFPEVSRRKLKCIEKSLTLKNLIHSDLEIDSEAESIIMESSSYTLLGLDLKNLDKLEMILKSIQVDFSSPTLLLSECAITYMDVEHSTKLITWVQRMFPNSAFAVYEQVHPYDGFGIVMLNHFSIIGSPLKSINAYPDEKSQQERFLKLGWSYCSASNVFNFFSNLSSDEKRRIQGLELFDEYEMWHEKCHHYVLIWASQGTIKTPSCFLNKEKNYFSEQKIQKRELKWKFCRKSAECQRFGHQTVLLHQNKLLVSGGFGQVEKKHQRIGGVAVLDCEKNTYTSVSVNDHLNLLGHRMYHTMTLLRNGTILVLGGRSSPNQVFKEVLLLNPSDQNSFSMMDNFTASQSNVVNIETKGELLQPSYRHSTTLIEHDGAEKVVVFGGCTLNKKGTDTCQILDTRDWNWLQISLQDNSPSPRHSHSSVSHKTNVIITGGLSADEIILNSVHLLDIELCIWKTLNVVGLLPRYSHTSHVLKNKLILVGGIGVISGKPPGFAIIDLESLQTVEVLMPAQDPEYPILLTNHTSHICGDQLIIVGGGGNCFSFGTHFSKHVFYIDLENLLELSL